tara:strand:+ start:82 stop:396 length:315 start_codon:yes stop_codon:yes gene_type:complete
MATVLASLKTIHTPELPPSHSDELSFETQIGGQCSVDHCAQKEFSQDSKTTEEPDLMIKEEEGTKNSFPDDQSLMDDKEHEDGKESNNAQESTNFDEIMQSIFI